MMRERQFGRDTTSATPRDAGGRGRLARRGRGEAAQALAEFALVLPIAVIVIFGLVDMARAMQSYVTLQEAARSAARYAVTGRIDCAGVPTQNRDNCIKNEVTVRTNSLNNHTSIATSFESWAYPAYADPATANNAGQPCDAIQITVSYTYKPMTPVFSRFIPQIPMSASERMLNEPFGPCASG